MKVALILAGGSGQRMGNTETPKQFLLLNDKAILLHTLEKFFLFKGCLDKIVIAVHPGWKAYTKDLITKNFPSDNLLFEVISGGKSRHETILLGLNYLRDNFEIKENDIILTHDAVRPFISYRIIKDNLEATAKYGAVDTVVQSIDTIVWSEDGVMITDIPKRNQYYHGQTPQSFFIQELIDVYDQFSKEQLEKTTDVAKLYRILDKPVYLVKGEQVNFKITTPFDLNMARAFIKGESLND